MPRIFATSRATAKFGFGVIPGNDSGAALKKPHLRFKLRRQIFQSLVLRVYNGVIAGVLVQEYPFLGVEIFLKNPYGDRDGSH